MPLSYLDFKNNLPATAREVIVLESFREAETNVAQKHSLSAIFKGDRDLALACRMTSHAMRWEERNNQCQKTGNTRLYTGLEIAQGFCNAVLKPSGHVYYPVPIKFENLAHTKYLILFVKGENGYYPFARFSIADRLPANQVTVEQAQLLDDPTVYQYCTGIQTLLLLDACEQNGLATDYLALRGNDLMTESFKGPSSNILIL